MVHGKRLGIAAAALLLAAMTSCLAQAATPCDAPAAAPITYVTVPGAPFLALPSRDGCHVYVAMLPQDPNDKAPMLAVLKRDNGAITLERTVDITLGTAGMALSQDERYLFIADLKGVARVATAELNGNGRTPAVQYIDMPPPPGRPGMKAPFPQTINVALTPDGHYLFAANEATASISVIDLQKGFDRAAVVGAIPTGSAPIALVFSPDGRTLYTTSESLREPDAAKECTREGSNSDARVNPAGAVLVVDVMTAEHDPNHAVRAGVHAGCSPVRLALSPDGKTAYVTARNSNAVLAFDTQKLLDDPAHARIATVPVGPAPVGIALIENGGKIIATNSNRFAGTSADHQKLTVIDTARMASGAEAVTGSIEAGAFPREIRITADGGTLLVTNFASRNVEFVDLARVLK